MQLEDALRDGGPMAALGAWLGPGADLSRADTWTRGFFADYAGQSSWSPSRRELRSVSAPVAVVTSESSPAHVVQACDACTALVPRALRLRDGDVVAAALALA